MIILSIYAGDNNSPQIPSESPTNTFDWTSFIDWPSSPDSKTSSKANDQPQKSPNHKLKEGGTVSTLQSKRKVKSNIPPKIQKQEANRRYRLKVRSDPARLELIKAAERETTRKRKAKWLEEVDRLPEVEREAELSRYKKLRYEQNKEYRIKQAKLKAERQNIKYEPKKKNFKLSEKERERGRKKAQTYRIRKKEREQQLLAKADDTGHT